jgi:basic membrane protein A
MAEGFRQGLQVVKPDAQLFVTNLNTWDDGPGATAAASAIFDKGADLILYDITTADQPVLKVSEARGKQTINYAYDLNYVDPAKVLTGLLVSVPNSMIVPAALWKDQKLEKKNYQVGLKEQAISLAPLRGKISKQAEDQIAQAQADIISGKLKLNINFNT